MSGIDAAMKPELPKSSLRFVRAKVGAWHGIFHQLCPRCRTGKIYGTAFFHLPARMHERCDSCGLKFEREEGYFLGAMYVSYALAIPLIALLTLIEHLILPKWSLFRLVVLASLICLPSTPVIWQYSRVIWIYFDRYFDPEDEQDEHRRSLPKG